MEKADDVELVLCVRTPNHMLHTNKQRKDKYFLLSNTSLTIKLRTCVLYIHTCILYMPLQHTAAISCTGQHNTRCAIQIYTQLQSRAQGNKTRDVEYRSTHKLESRICSKTSVQTILVVCNQLCRVLKLKEFNSEDIINKPK